MSRTPTAIEKDRCDAYRKAFLALKAKPDDPEARESLALAAADLKPTLVRGRLDHAGWRFTLDRAGVLHCVKMPPAAILAQARRPAR